MRAGEYAHRDMPEWAGRRTAAENKILYQPTYWFIFLFRKSYLSKRYGCGRSGGENGKEPLISLSISSSTGNNYLGNNHL